MTKRKRNKGARFGSCDRGPTTRGWAVSQITSLCETIVRRKAIIFQERTVFDEWQPIETAPVNTDVLVVGLASTTAHWPSPSWRMAAPIQPLLTIPCGTARMDAR